ncbi:MAG TPA: cytochrome c oxidase subunit 3 [Opitutaceae bacterium]|jgi:cytochrome c oxidase subunit 3
MSETAAVSAEVRERHEITTQLGMWGFLATEVLFFGGFFMAYALYRHSYPEAFAEGGRHMAFGLGTTNTALLLISSVFVAIADRAVRAGRRGLTLGCLATAWLMGLAFLGIKAIEYTQHVSDHLVPGRHFLPGQSSNPRLQLFMYLYFGMTGLHAFHMIMGLIAVAWLMNGVRSGRIGPSRPEPVAVIGLYWHFVDCVWVVLYPLFYLVGR